MILKGSDHWRRTFALFHRRAWIMGGVAVIALSIHRPARPQSPRIQASKSEVNETLLTIGGADFRIRETGHFAIGYDTPYAEVRSLTGRLEGAYMAIWRFCKDNGLSVWRPTERLGVLFFDRYEDFTRYAATAGFTASSTAGFYNPQTNLAAFCNMLHSPNLQKVARQIERAERQLKRHDDIPLEASRMRQRREDQRTSLSNLKSRRDALVERFNRLVIQHEAAHQMLFNIGVHARGSDNPLWLVEGLACQFEVP